MSSRRDRASSLWKRRCMSYGPRGIMIWVMDGYGYDGRGFFCIPICKRFNAVAPPTTFGTEEWRVPRRVPCHRGTGPAPRG